MAGEKIDLATIASKLDAVLFEQHQLRQLLHRMTVPVNVLSASQASSRLGVSASTLDRITARAVFTDARAPERRVKGAPRTYYADEIDVYRSEGEKGVKRLRVELGRL